jgi:hypothetical protein
MLEEEEVTSSRYVCHGRDPGPAPVVTLADSIDEFSCSQGADNWYYGYSTGAFNGSNFVQMSYCASRWFISESITYPSCGGSALHPQSSRWVVRRWVSEVAGTVRVSGGIKKYNTNGGDGVTGYIFVDGVQVWSQAVAATDSTGFEYAIEIEVSVGSHVDFAVSPNAGDYADGTYFWSTIEQ